MVDLEKKYLDEVKTILKLHVPNCRVRAFGSRVTGKAVKFSDLDIAVEGETELGLRTMADLSDAFSESNLPFRVDVLDWLAISDEFRKRINRQYDIIQRGIEHD